MIQFKRAIPGRISAVLLAATVMALSLSFAGASGADAAQIDPTCTVQSGGASQSESTVPGGSEAGGSVAPDAANQVPSATDSAPGCMTFSVGGTVSVSNGVTCAFTLPSGVAPGSTIVVRPSSEGTEGGCSMEIVEPTTGSFGTSSANIVMGEAGVQFCAVESNGATSVTLQPAGTSGFTVSPGAGTVTIETPKEDGAAGTALVPVEGQIEVSLSCDAALVQDSAATGVGTTGVFQEGGCAIVVEGNSTGAESNNSVPANQESGAAAGGSAGIACPIDASGGTVTAEPGTADATTPTWSCVMGTDPNVAPVCTRTP